MDRRNSLTINYYLQGLTNKEIRDMLISMHHCTFSIVHIKRILTYNGILRRGWILNEATLDAVKRHIINLLHATSGLHEYHFYALTIMRARI